MTLATIRLKRDTAANWTANNPVLALGEPGWETDNLKGKVGDGVTGWNSLPYSLGYRAIGSHNAAIAQQTGFAADTYLVGSSNAIPAGRLQAKTIHRVRFSLQKTAAGVAAPVITVRTGTTGTITDTLRTQMTFGAQTAATDLGTVDVFSTFRSVGSGTAAVLTSWAEIRHINAATGFTTFNVATTGSTSGGFDSTTATFIGISINGGSGVFWTVDQVQADLLNLAP